MNTELTKRALEKVGNPHVLVNLVSRRVRQLNGGGGASRPLVDAPPAMGVADIALLEVIEGKVGWEVNDPEVTA
jgi:DNA-directed RNA polymerase subunit omega